MHEEIKIPNGAKLIQMLAAVQANESLNASTTQQMLGPVHFSRQCVTEPSRSSKANTTLQKQDTWCPVECSIYNSPFRKEPNSWELRLQKVKPLMHQPATATKTRSHRSLSSWLACTSARSFPHSASLPPIDRKPCQGPFRDINEVLHQRYKPLEPTLRVAEPINHLELAREALKQDERMRNVNDKMFLPFSSFHKKEKYIPMIHSSSKYNPSSYGQKYFRSQDPKKWISGKKLGWDGKLLPLHPEIESAVTSILMIMNIQLNDRDYDDPN
ncbi:hypothetical protein ACRRTK_005168 [Alexandromys fortis]